MMDSVFVPSGEVSAILSQLSASRLDLRRSEGLNGIPDEYYRAVLMADALGLLDDPRVLRRMALLESKGVAAAMAEASSLDRMASVLPNDNLRWSRPDKVVSYPDFNRRGAASGERMPPEHAGRVYPDGVPPEGER